MKRSMFAALLVASFSFGAEAEAEVSARNPLEAAALQAAQGRVAKPDRFVTQSIRLVPAVSEAIAADSNTVRVVDVNGPNQAGMVRVELELASGSRAPLPFRATVRGKVIGPALVAGQTLLHKAAIEPGALTIEESDLTRLSRPPLRKADALTDRVPSRTISKGRVLHAELFEPEPLIRRGDPVELVYRSGRVRLTLQAVALVDAAAGDPATARVASSGARVSGTLDADGRLAVRQRIR